MDEDVGLDKRRNIVLNTAFQTSAEGVNDEELPMLLKERTVDLIADRQTTFPSKKRSNAFALKLESVSI